MNPKRKNGITLTELLVASVLIGIVMIGVASFSVSIQQLQGATNKSTVLAMKVRSTMARITKDAYLAVGDSENCGKDGNAGDDVTCGWGVRYNASNNKEGICFRHDTTSGTPNETPETYLDDEWICYYADNKEILYLCGDPPTPPANVPVKNNGDCRQPNNYRIALLNLDDVQINAKEGTDPDFHGFYKVVEDASGHLETIEITLFGIYDGSNQAPTAHPITNPTHTLTTRISPIGHSR